MIREMEPLPLPETVVMLIVVLLMEALASPLFSTRYVMRYFPFAESTHSLKESFHHCSLTNRLGRESAPAADVRGTVYAITSTRSSIDIIDIIFIKFRDLLASSGMGLENHRENNNSIFPSRPLWLIFFAITLILPGRN